MHAPTINAKRTEKRLCFQEESDAVSAITKEFEEVVYSENRYSLNFLFDTPDFSLDVKYKIKARRYVSSPQLNRVDHGDAYLLDFKFEKDGASNKERTEGTLEEHIKRVRSLLPDFDLLPRAGFVYHRSHYQSEQYPNTRITIDNNILFFLLHNDMVTNETPYQEKQFEFKYQEGDASFEAYIKNLIERFHGSGTMSKKERAQLLGKSVLRINI